MLIFILLKPWYAHGIAEAILRTTNLSVPLKVSASLFWMIDKHENLLYQFFVCR